MEDVGSSCSIALFVDSGSGVCQLREDEEEKESEGRERPVREEVKTQD